MRLSVIFGTMTTIALLFTSSIASNNNANAAPNQTARIRNSDRLAQNSQQQADNLLTAGNQKFGTRNYAEAYLNRGLALANLDDNRGAIADYNLAINVNPNYYLAYNNRAWTKSVLGDPKGAVADYDYLRYATRTGNRDRS